MILDRILVPGLGALLAVSLAGAGILSWRLDTAQDALATEQLARAQERTALAQAAGDAQAHYRLIEAAMQTVKDQADAAAQKERARLARTAAVHRAERDSLRQQIAAYAAGGGGEATSDTLDACRARAAELGRAVDDGLRVQADMAEAFGALAVDYRALYVSWPKVRAW